LGGPGTSFSGLPKRGTSIFVAIKPIGLSVGPVNTRARNPYRMKISTQMLAVTRKLRVKITTMAATNLAA